jgi:hypothetical protein
MQATQPGGAFGDLAGQAGAGLVDELAGAPDGGLQLADQPRQLASGAPAGAGKLAAGARRGSRVLVRVGPPAVWTRPMVRASLLTALASRPASVG